MKTDEVIEFIKKQEDTIAYLQKEYDAVLREKVALEDENVDLYNRFIKVKKKLDRLESDATEKMNAAFDGLPPGFGILFGEGGAEELAKAIKALKGIIPNKF